MRPDEMRSKIRTLAGDDMPVGRHRLRWLLLLLCVMLSTGIFAISASVGWGSIRDSDDEKSHVPIAAGEPAVAGHAERHLKASGFVVPSQRAVVSSEVVAKIVELRAREGDAVAQGSLVVRLDDASPRAELILAQARVAAIQSRLGELTVDQRLAEQVLHQARELFGAGFGSELTVLKAEASFQSVIERRKTVHADLSAANAEVARVKALMSKYQIYAPIGGAVAQQSAHLGEVVSNEATTTGGILTIVSLENPHVEVDIAEALMHLVRFGGAVRVSFEALPRTEVEGTVLRVLPTIDRNKATARVRIGLAANNLALRPGMVAHVQFVGVRNVE